MGAINYRKEAKATLNNQPHRVRDKLLDILSDTTFVYPEDTLNEIYDVIAANVIDEADGGVVVRKALKEEHDEAIEEAYAEGERTAKRAYDRDHGEKIIAEYDRGYAKGLDQGRQDAEHAFRKIISPNG